MILLAYLNGEGGYAYLAKKYSVPAKWNIEKWVNWTLQQTKNQAEAWLVEPGRISPKPGCIKTV